jgi:hypothetical protein
MSVVDRDHELYADARVAAAAAANLVQDEACMKWLQRASKRGMEQAYRSSTCYIAPR